VSTTLRIAAVLSLVSVVAWGQEQAKPAPVDAEGLEFFEKKIRPVLVDKCYSCHSADAKKLKAGLRLDTREGTLKGGESGSASVLPGDPDHSLLLKAIRYGKDDELKMPPKGDKLPPEVIADVEAWIRRGAPDPRGGGDSKAADLAKARRHWAFQPPKDPPLPAVKQKDWVKSPIDAFILATLEANGMKPSAGADRRTLIRRATLDLVGLPPTGEEIDAFIKDTSPDAWEKVVDRLLSSPLYGERWGRHWLDIARYSDTKGYVFQEERRYPYSYTYRDWVVRALNEDLPYDQFLVQQIAADRLPLGEDKRPLAAMGFLTLGRRFLNRLPDIIDDRLDVLCRGTMGLTVACARCHDHKFDPIPTKDYYSLYGVFASSIEPKEPPLIGMGQKTPANLEYETEVAKLQGEVTKYREKRHADILAALRQPKVVADYLMAAQEGKSLKNDEEIRSLAQKKDLIAFVLGRWKSFLDKAAKAKNPIFAEWQEKPVRETADRLAAQLAKADAADELKAVLSGPESPTAVALADLDKLYTRADRDKQRQLENKVEAFKASHPGAPQRAMAMEDGPLHEPHVLVRGNPNNLGEKVPRQFLSILSPEKREPFKEGSGRLELARMIASKDNPLTARVIVNRVWGHHFGGAIVRTPSDFGFRSDPPTHPELLDWLALRFVEQGWSLKKLHKLILATAAWQQRSDDVAAYKEKDPDNRLVWKCSRQRLDFEAMRDSFLAVSGQLDLTMGGRPVMLSENPTGKQKQQAETIINTVGDPTQETFSRRRSVYLFIDRQNLPGTFRNFDFASPDTHSPQRYTTTVPQQALFLMNSPFMVDQSRALGKRPEVAAAADAPGRVRALYRIVFGRDPSDEEIALGRRLLDQPPPPPVVWKPGPWHYGYGEVDEAAQKVASFTPLPHFTGRQWQGGPALPDPVAGWAYLNAQGGHAGNDLKHATIRRWVAPEDGAVTVSGTVSHKNKGGNGVRARLFSSRSGELASWTLKQLEAEMKIKSIDVKKDDTIDFVVDFRGEITDDEFVWAPVIQMKSSSAANGGQMIEWNAASQFAGPPPAPLTPLEKYAQTLMLTNEFFFLD